jgi:hypothetical protein
MATRKRSSSNSSTGERAFAVILEGLRADFRVFGESLHGIDGKVDALDGRVQALETKVGTLETSLDAFRSDVDRKFAQVDARLDRVENAILEHTRELKTVGRRMGELESSGR